MPEDKSRVDAGLEEEDATGGYATLEEDGI